MANHKLKITPQHFIPVRNRQKTAEIRKNDRDYQVDDILVLQEWLDGSYTGGVAIRTVIHVADVGSYLPGYVLLSME